MLEIFSILGQNIDQAILISTLNGRAPFLYDVCRQLSWPVLVKKWGTFSGFNYQLQHLVSDLTAKAFEPTAAFRYRPEERL